jgi:hypothetical protein
MSNRELRLIRSTQPSRRKWKYYDRDGAIFRSATESAFVDEVWTVTGLLPYGGDRQKPAFFGDVIPASALPIAALRLSGAKRPKTAVRLVPGRNLEVANNFGNSFPTV